MKIQRPKLDIFAPMSDFKEILRENDIRNGRISTPYNPLEANGLSEEERMKKDFPFWAARMVRIKPKGGGKDIPFILNRPQRVLVEKLESMRRADRPIRLILLKARQWGGSTCVQLYMAWLQLVHSEGLNSLIIAHQITASEEIKDMFDRMIVSYGRPDDAEEWKSPFTMKRVGGSGSSFRLLERDCKIKIGTAERPDSSRGGDYNLVHLSEVGLWKRTTGKMPEDIVRSATSGVLLQPLTMIVMESTANGAGTFFHHEYLAAKNGESQFQSLFIPWFLIDSYSLPIAEKEEFARQLYEKRHDQSQSGRSVSGEYLWSLWERGATLEAIHWYIEERKKYSDHAGMASEYPSDDIEAFAHSGERVFAPEKIERLRRGVKDPDFIGEMNSDGDFIEDSAGKLMVWEKPDKEQGNRLENRYLTVVDVGGRSAKADWSVIAVFDRMGEEGPHLAAQWRGHIDHDLLAANAARIAAWYDNALLVIESNTLETRDLERNVDGDQAPFILRELEASYPNLYRRRAKGGVRKPGFHTNVMTKPMVIGCLVKSVREGLYVERDMAAIDELIQYERKQNGSYGASIGCHDDILMTRAIAMYIHEHEMGEVRAVVKPLDEKYRGRSDYASFGY